VTPPAGSGDCARPGARAAISANSPTATYIPDFSKWLEVTGSAPERNAESGQLQTKMESGVIVVRHSISWIATKKLAETRA